MQNPKEAGSAQTGQNKQTKPKKKKKEGKIQHVWEMSQKGSSVKEIAEKTGLKEQIVRSYLWRKANPTKYAELLQRYQQKRKKKTAKKAKEPSNEDKK